VIELLDRVGAGTVVLDVDDSGLSVVALEVDVEVLLVEAGAVIRRDARELGGRDVGCCAMHVAVESAGLRGKAHIDTAIGEGHVRAEAARVALLRRDVSLRDLERENVAGRDRELQFVAVGQSAEQRGVAGCVVRGRLAPGLATDELYGLYGLENFHGVTSGLGWR
jgi:hypothetical protein